MIEFSPKKEEYIGFHYGQGWSQDEFQKVINSILNRFKWLAVLLTSDIPLPYFRTEVYGALKCQSPDEPNLTDRSNFRKIHGWYTYQTKIFSMSRNLIHLAISIRS